MENVCTYLIIAVHRATGWRRTRMEVGVGGRDGKCVLCTYLIIENGRKRYREEKEGDTTEGRGSKRRAAE